MHLLCHALLGHISNFSTKDPAVSGIASATKGVLDTLLLVTCHEVRKLSMLVKSMVDGTSGMGLPTAKTASQYRPSDGRDLNFSKRWIWFHTRMAVLGPLCKTYVFRAQSSYREVCGSVCPSVHPSIHPSIHPSVLFVLCVCFYLWFKSAIYNIFRWLYCFVRVSQFEGCVP